MSKLFRKISLKEEGEIPLYLVKQNIRIILKNQNESIGQYYLYLQNLNLA